MGWRILTSLVRTSWVFALSLGWLIPARAGITIHYAGTASSSEAMAKILSAAAAFAKANNWKVTEASAASGRLERTTGERIAVYEGKITGVIITINDACEPVALQFDRDRFLQDEVKTQFAGADVHVRIVALLESIRPCFSALEVDDEGEYWDTHDRKILEGHIDEVDATLAGHKRKYPEIQIGFRMRNGRIADIAK